MADSYVCSGATMTCSMGTCTAELTVLPSRTVNLTGRPMANISDHLTMVNLAPFGCCRSMEFPATAIATEAAHGELTPMPCMHDTPFPWMGGKNDYIIKGEPALLKSSTCQCKWGGTISIVDDGQTPSGTIDLSQITSEVFEKKLKNNGLDADTVLDGIQLGLSVAGFAPGLGAVPDLLNAAIYAIRGNWNDAGMCMLSAIPGIGDAAAGAKFATLGVKAAKAAKVSTSVRKGEKIRGEIPPTVVNKVWKKLGKGNYDNPPYKLGGKVQSIELTEDTTFVRFYNSRSPQPGMSSQKGQWVMRKEDVVGLSPKEIKEKFALKDEPLYMCDVHLRKGTRMHKGIANKVDGWGAGGGVQYDLRLNNTGDFTNETIIWGIVK